MLLEKLVDGSSAVLLVLGIGDDAGGDAVDGEHHGALVLEEQLLDE